MNPTDITTEILTSKKYTNIDETVVLRITTETIPKYTKRKDIIKAVKKELHIIHESFLPDDCHKKADTLITNYTGTNITTDRELTLKLLPLHSSTKERIGQVKEIYQYLNEYINTEDEILDIGCGFNPFALPFLDNKPKTYTAYDINTATITLLNKYFERTPSPYQALINDAATQTPKEQADTALLFKIFPLLERQKKGRSFEILKEMNCQLYIISFPLKSASGKEKGMEQFYSTQFETELPNEFTIIDKKVFTNEMFYILEKSL